MEQFMEWMRGAATAVALMFTAAPADNAAFYGYAEGDYTRLAPREGGAVTELRVARGDRVAAGQIVAVLESGAETAARDQARAVLAQAEAQAANLRKGRRAQEIDALVAQRAQAEASLRLTEAQLQRQQRLIGSPAASTELLDQARAAYERDRGRVAELVAQISLARQAARDDEVAAAEAAADAARAALDQADWRLGQRVLTAPAAATVIDTMFTAGEYVAAGAPIVSLLIPARVKLRFFVPEAALAGLRLGDTVQVRCDGCAAHSAVVSYVSPRAEFTPPVIYSRESRAKLVYMVEARPDDPAAFHPGQPIEIAAPGLRR